jgi:hypothetical protein
VAASRQWQLARDAAERYERILTPAILTLEPGGRIAVSLWCDIRENPYFYELVQAVTNHIGAETAAGLNAAFSLSDSKAIKALLAEAGFKHVKVSVAQLDLELPKPQEFVPQHVSATPMAAGFRVASEEARRAVVHDVSERLVQYETDQGIRVPFRAHVVMGIR